MSWNGREVVFVAVCVNRGGRLASADPWLPPTAQGDLEGYRWGRRLKGPLEGVLSAGGTQ